MSAPVHKLSHRDLPFTVDMLAKWKEIFAISCLVAALLVGASFAQDLILNYRANAGSSDKIWLLDVDSEQSAFTWLSIVATFAAAWLLFQAAGDAAMRGSRFKWHWYFLAALFLLLSFDEFASIHEKISAILSSRVQNTGLMYFAWAAPAGVVSLIGLAAFIPFIRSFPPRLAVLLILSAAAFLCGAVGLEMIGGSVAEIEGIESFRFRMLTNMEEGLEIAGVLIFIYVLLAYLEGAEATPHRR
ncbi:hypothetical protein [Chelativorans salis]|uniref:Uncharacterized protein n=1 Tax=Chelativorans salis TaxID=2978478 RepID=A0ABT2LJR2_9HYPH|nr:hypothetical protein [Chelativorans sp. EGI FJ00035]MCT7374840.1 hypothetical protein [Chelativorans sp. EGI FJ00035]